MSTARERRVVIVAFDGVQPLDVAGPHEVFAGAGRGCRLARSVGRVFRDRRVEDRWARVRRKWPRARNRTAARSRRSGSTPWSWREGTAHWPPRPTTSSSAGSSATASRCRRVAAVCSGTFLAGAAGLLGGRRVTTHWARADELAAAYPEVQVDPDPIYVRDGRVWSSAGVTAGIDLSLALVEDDLGIDVAQTVARWLVMFLHRPGGQTQFASPVWVPRAERSAVRAVQARVETDPAEDHRMPALADAAAMSVRHFTRVFTFEVGESPGRFVERTRLEAARRELETSSATLGVVASRCGLGSAETLRRVFHRHLGVSPDAYRRRFRTGSEERTSA